VLKIEDCKEIDIAGSAVSSPRPLSKIVTKISSSSEIWSPKVLGHKLHHKWCESDLSFCNNFKTFDFSTLILPSLTLLQPDLYIKCTRGNFEMCLL